MPRDNVPPILFERADKLHGGVVDVRAVLGQTRDGGWITDMPAEAYIALLRERYVYPDARRTLYDPWFVRLLRQENRLAATHTADDEAYPMITDAESQLIFPVYTEGERSRTTSHGHWWLAVALTATGVLYCWDSLCVDARIAPPDEQRADLAHIERYLNQRLEMVGLRRRVWRYEQRTHAQPQFGPSCGIYMLKAIELILCERETTRAWVSPLTRADVAYARRQIAVSLQRRRLVDGGAAAATVAQHTPVWVTSSDYAPPARTTGIETPFWSPRRRPRFDADADMRTAAALLKRRREDLKRTLSNERASAGVVHVVTANADAAFAAVVPDTALARHIMRVGSVSRVLFVSANERGRDAAFAVTAALSHVVSAENARIIVAHVSTLEPRACDPFPITGTAFALPPQFNGSPDVVVTFDVSARAAYTDAIRQRARWTRADFLDVWWRDDIAHRHACWVLSTRRPQRCLAVSSAARGCLALHDHRDVTRQHRLAREMRLESQWRCVPMCCGHAPE